VLISVFLIEAIYGSPNFFLSKYAEKPAENNV
jgi:hypothetical protein